MAVNIKNPLMIVGGGGLFDIEVVNDISKYYINEHKLGAICIVTDIELDSEEIKLSFVNSVCDNNNESYNSNTLSFMLSNASTAKILTFDTNKLLIKAISISKYYLVDGQLRQTFSDEFLNETVIANVFIVTRDGLEKLTTEKLPYFYAQQYELSAVYKKLMSLEVNQYLKITDTVEESNDVIYCDVCNVSNAYLVLKTKTVMQYISFNEEAVFAINGIPIQ